jgi:hypothetical protein
MLDQSDWVSVRCAQTGLLAGDMRMSAHTTQHLVLGLLRDDATGLVCDSDGRALEVPVVLELIGRLRNAGLSAGDVIMAKAMNDLPGVTAILAIWAIGATLCPVDPSGSSAAKASKSGTVSPGLPIVSR